MKHASALRRRSTGFSLIELMVAMAIGLVLSLAVARVLIFSQESRLNTTAVNDINQTGTYLGYVMDRALRSAGSGFAQRRNSLGCLLTGTGPSGAVLPRTTDLPAPFASVPRQFRLAPVVVYKGAALAGSDVIAVMTGTAGYGESALPLVAGSATTSQIALPNTIGYSANDIVLLVEDDSSLPCMLQQVSGSFSDLGEQTLPLAGTYYSATTNGLSLTSFGLSGSSYAMSLGGGAPSATTAPPNPPQFQLFGVGANNTLYSHDILRVDGSDTAVPLADGVFEMRAIYHVDSTPVALGKGDGIADEWKDPGSAGYTAAELLDGSAAANDRLRRIVAVRVGLVLRSQLAEKDQVGPVSYTLFSGLPGATTRTLGASERQFRYRVIEITVPLRNALMPPPP